MNVSDKMINLIDEEQFIQEQIEALTELEKVQLVNRMFIKLKYNYTLFEPEGKDPIHPGVLHETYYNLNLWMKNKTNILREEYDQFVMDNKNNEVKQSKGIKEKETTKSGWDNGETFKTIEVKLGWKNKSKDIRRKEING